MQRLSHLESALEEEKQARLKAEQDLIELRRVCSVQFSFIDLPPDDCKSNSTVVQVVISEHPKMMKREQTGMQYYILTQLYINEITVNNS